MDKLFSIMPTKYAWEYAAPQRNRGGGQFQPFNASNSDILEKALKDQRSAGSVQIAVGPQTYECSFRGMTYTVVGNNNKAYKIRRSEVVSAALQERRDVEDRAHAFLAVQDRRPALGALFMKYATDDEIGFDVAEFAEALGTDAGTDVAVLVLAYYGQCGEMGEFTQEQFIMSMARLQCTTELELQAKLPELRQLLDFVAYRPTPFLTSFWEFLFFYFKEGRNQLLPMKTAMAVMDLVLAGHWEVFPTWRSFCEAINEKSTFGMSKMESIGLDEWRALLRFAHKFPKSDGLEEAFEGDDEFWTEIFDVFVGDYFPDA